VASLLVRHHRRRRRGKKSALEEEYMLAREDMSSSSVTAEDPPSSPPPRPRPPLPSLPLWILFGVVFVSAAVFVFFGLRHFVEEKESSSKKDRISALENVFDIVRIVSETSLVFPESLRDRVTFCVDPTESFLCVFVRGSRVSGSYQLVDLSASTSSSLMSPTMFSTSGSVMKIIEPTTSILINMHSGVFREHIRKRLISFRFDLVEHHVGGG
jgi:hypothetical protein